MTAIRGLAADRVRIPFRRPFQTAHGSWREREAWIVRIADGDGRIGLGEAVLEPGADEAAERLLSSLVREAAARASALPSRAELERHGVAGAALNAAIESALLDLDRRPVPARIAPGGEGVGVNATIASLNAAAGAVAALAAVESGFTTLKVKAGDERDTAVLVDRVRAIRTAVGPAVKLRLDVNGAWDLATAEARLSAIAGFDIEYVEQPLPVEEADGLATLRRRLRVRVPIAADESASSVAAVRGLLAAQAVDVVVVKLARVGGLAAAGEIAEAAAERGVPVVVSTLFETGIGIAAALHAAAMLPEVRLSGAAAPPDHGLATAGLLEHDLLENSLIVDRGRMRTSGGNASGGLGVVLDRRALERFRVEAVGSPA